MPFSSAEIDALFDPHLTVAATYTDRDNVAVAVQVIFESAYQLVQLGDGMGVASSTPAATVKTADMPEAKKNEILTVGGQDYYIQEVQPDGTGITVLILSRDRG